MKLIFKLWGLHPSYTISELRRYPWVLYNPITTENDERDHYCISFLSSRMEEDDRHWADNENWANYEPRKI